MSRERADDYDQKIKVILDAAAVLFARTGYPGAKLQEVAKACGASKSMLYHYFPTKDDLLFAMLKEHLEGTILSAQEAIFAEDKPEKQFVSFVNAFLHRSAHSRRRHIVAMNDMKFLPKSLQKPLLELERKILVLIADLLRQIKPGLAEDVYKPYAMLLLGMLNWTDTWFSSSGPMKTADLCERASRLFLRGFLSER